MHRPRENPTSETAKMIGRTAYKYPDCRVRPGCRCSQTADTGSRVGREVKGRAARARDRADARRQIWKESSR